MIPTWGQDWKWTHRPLNFSHPVLAFVCTWIALVSPSVSLPRGLTLYLLIFYVFIVYIPGNTVGSPRLVKQKSNQIKVCTVLGRLPLCSSTTNPKFPGRSLSDSVYQWSACRSLPFLNVALHGLLLLVNWIMHPKSLWPGRWTHFDFPPSVALSWLFLVWNVSHHHPILRIFWSVVRRVIHCTTGPHPSSHS